MDGIKSVLIIGNMAGKMGRGQAVCESLKVLLENAGWRVFIASGYVPWYMRIADMLWTAFKYRAQYPVALIEVFSGRAFIWAEVVAWLLRRLKKPYILALYGGDLPFFSERHSSRVKKLLNSASVVISPSEYTRKLMLPYRSDIQVLSYGVDQSVYNFRLRDKPEPLLMTIRAFHSIYNLSMAPKVLAMLVEEFPDIQLVMTGGDKQDGSWESVERISMDLNIKNRVKMLGFVPREDLPGLLDRAGVLLNTPNVDNTPVSLLEAMACGLCIVSTNVGGLPYLLEDGVDALLVPPNDPEAMASAVRRILTGPGLAPRLSLNARRKAEQFDWSVILPQWENLFCEVAADSGAGKN